MPPALPALLAPGALPAIQVPPDPPAPLVLPARKALPALEIGQLHSQDYVTPRTELEATLAAIWAEVLRVERVGVRDNFFELGGHSLLATQIASRVQKTLQRDVPLRAMFECSTVAELAEYIDGLAANEISAEKVDRLSDLMAELEGL